VVVVVVVVVGVVKEVEREEDTINKEFISCNKIWLRERWVLDHPELEFGW
jgi:hypothetical protein